MLQTVTSEEWDALMAKIDAAKASRATKMPTERDAIAQMFEAYTRLKELGWNEAMYCPKDGSMFSVVEVGSTGIHECNYLGEWPTGNWWVYDGDMWPAHPALWRPRKPDDPTIDHGLAMDYSCCDHETKEPQ